jgi:hypothetical protein
MDFDFCKNVTGGFNFSNETAINTYGINNYYCMKNKSSYIL